MSHAEPDLNKNVQFHAKGATRQHLFIALALFAVSFAAVIGADEAKLPFTLAGAAVGLIWSGYEFWRLFNPDKPMVVLSAVGVDYRMQGGGAVFIPWGEIHDVSAIEITTSKARFADVTALKVSKRFFEKEIEDQLSLFGGQSHLFVPKGNFVQIALHHHVLGVAPQPLREAISSRWYRFNNRGKSTDRVNTRRRR